MLWLQASSANPAGRWVAMLTVVASLIVPVATEAADSSDKKADAVTAGMTDPGKKLRGVLWVGGHAHDFDAIPKVLEPAMEKLIPIELTVVRDGSFLDKASLENLDIILADHCVRYTKGVLNEAQKAKFLELVRGGLGVVAVHASYWSFLKWDEVHELHGARFTVHGSPKARILVKTVDAKHPITRTLDASFEVVSELYESTPLAKDCHVLARAREVDKDAWHPSVWTRMYGKGRVVTILPGHWPDSYKVDGFQKLIARSILWASRRLDSDK